MQNVWQTASQCARSSECQGAYHVARVCPRRAQVARLVPHAQLSPFTYNTHIDNIQAWFAIWWGYS